MQNSKIEWTDHTFNPWWGCMKVSEGCKNCYAQTLDNRWKGGHWGPGSQRKQMSDKHWSQPLIWNEQAQKAGVKAKVFCASMGDVFEDHSDLDEQRARLFNLIDRTPNLIWQLLTKRPENILAFTPVWSKTGFPDNVWIGTSVENQEAADKRIPHLLSVPSKVRFLSCEPLLGPVDLTNITQIDWVICGGESGHGARPIHPEWARSLRDQCTDANIPYFFKQWGEWMPHMWSSHNPKYSEMGSWGDYGFYKGAITNPQCTFGNPHNMIKVGKKYAGNLLDGFEHKEFPTSA